MVHKGHARGPHRAYICHISQLKNSFMVFNKRKTIKGKKNTKKNVINISTRTRSHALSVHAYRDEGRKGGGRLSDDIGAVCRWEVKTGALLDAPCACVDAGDALTAAPPVLIQPTSSAPGAGQLPLTSWCVCVCACVGFGFRARDLS